MSDAPHPVFVVGCPRSGTSPLARWLDACGLATVSDERRSARYPAGYFEHLPLLMFHQALERRPRGADHRITTEPYLTREDLEDPFVAEVYRLAVAPLLEDGIEFVKYPQLALSIEFLFEQFPESHVVGLWRSPAVTFRSLVTREFPVEMIALSGVKAVLLWSLYAYHLVEAKRRWPERVTILEIDRFLESPDAGPALMERLGRPPDTAVPIEQAVDRSLWRTNLGVRWRVYHGVMALLCRIFRSRLGSQREALADQDEWQRKLRELADLPGGGAV